MMGLNEVKYGKSKREIWGSTKNVISMLCVTQMKLEISFHWCQEFRGSKRMLRSDVCQ